MVPQREVPKEPELGEGTAAERSGAGVGGKKTDEPDVVAEVIGFFFTTPSPSNSKSCRLHDFVSSPSDQTNEKAVVSPVILL